MLGFGRSISVGLAGWLWADLLLGLFAIFLAANAVSPLATLKSGVDPKPVEVKIGINGAALLSTNTATASAEQQRIAQALQAQLASVAPGRKPAIVFAYGAHQSAAEGDKIAKLGTALMTTGSLAGTAMSAYHELVPGDTGSYISFVVYFHE